MTTRMTTLDKCEAIDFIQKQLTEWAAFQSDEHFKVHGSKAINQAEQLCKKLRHEYSLQLLDDLVEQNQHWGLYEVHDVCNNSLGIANIN